MTRKSQFVNEAMPVSAIECAPVTLAEEVDAVALLGNMLIRHLIEDAESGFVVNGRGEIVPVESPIDLLAERLGVHPQMLRAQLHHTDLDLLDPVAREACERLQRLDAENTPLVTGGEFASGAGMDPQLSDAYRGWLSWLNTAVCRRPKFTEDPEEMPQEELDIAGEFALQCETTYDGWLVRSGKALTGIEGFDLGPQGQIPEIKPWFWTSPVALVAWSPQGEERPSISLRAIGRALREAAQDGTAEEQRTATTAGLRPAVSLALRMGQGVLAYKVIARNAAKQAKQAEAKIEALRETRKTVLGTKAHCAHPGCGICRANRQSAQHDLTEATAQILGKAAGWRLWDTVANGVPATMREVPYYVEDGYGGVDVDVHVEPVARPDLAIVRRCEVALRREADRKARDRTGIVWVDLDVLPEDLQERLLGVLPGLPAGQKWAIQTFFNPYDCQSAPVEDALAESHGWPAKVRQTDPLGYMHWSAVSAAEREQALRDPGDTLMYGPFRPDTLVDSTCGAATKRGTPCRNKAHQGGRCKRHQEVA